MIPATDSDYENKASVNALDFVIILFKYKTLIILIPVLALLSATLFLFHEDKPIESFSSEIIIEPYSAGLPKTKTLLTSAIAHKLILQMKEDPLFLKEYGLEGRTDLNYSELQPRILKKFNINLDGGLLFLTFTSQNPDLSLRVIDTCLSLMAEYFRNQDVPVFRSQLAVYKKQFETTKDPLLRSNLASEIINLSFKQERASAGGIYGFYIVSDKRNFKVTQVPSSHSRKAPIFIFLISLILSYILALCIEYFRNIKNTDPQKIILLKQYMSFRKKGDN